MLEAGLVGAAAKGFSASLGKMLAEHAVRSAIGSAEKIEKVRTDISPYVEATFNKCSTIKTLLNPQTPANFLSIYATQRFSVENKIIDQYDFVEIIKTRLDHIIITGSGGSGKSMFMKYLWLSLFENGNGRIPIFIELRNMSGGKYSNYEEYIRSILCGGRSSISSKDFLAKLSNGDVVLLFDGFDEVSAAHSEEIQKFIIELSDNYPKTKIVISSRPDDRFVSWPSFYVSSVSSMRKSDVVELVEKAEFDPTYKKLFLSKIEKEELYEKHNSFMENPLLASMMLLTFSHDMNIPDKMHSFYGQAFDALFDRHDSYKPGGYKREFKTSLPKDSFKELLSYFCLISYNEQDYEFSYPEAIDYINKASKISNIEIDADKFLLDLKDCVCILVPEGLQYIFSHRSFQEYFSAYCLSYVTRKGFGKFVERFSKRPGDKTAILLSDMAHELFRDEYIIPNGELHRRAISPPAGVDKISHFMEACDKSASFTKSKGDSNYGLTTSHVVNDINFYFNLIFSIEKNTTPRRAYDSDDVALDEILDGIMTDIDECDEIEVEILPRRGSFVFNMSVDGVSVEIGNEQSKRLSSIFKKTGTYLFFESEFKIVKSYVEVAMEEKRHSIDTMKDIFGI